MFKNIAKKAEEIENINKVISDAEEVLKKKKEELKKMKEGVAIEEFLTGSNARYLRLGEATHADSGDKETFGLVVIDHLGFLVWEKYRTHNDGRLCLEREGLSRVLQSVCLCGCGVDARKSGGRSSLGEIGGDAKICRGFFAKWIVLRSLSAARDNGIKVIFSRHGDCIGFINDIVFCEIVLLVLYIAFL